jgi:hypothetical protein
MSNPDGPVHPTGRRYQLIYEGKDVNPSLAPPYYPDPELSEVAEVVGAPVLPYLTPDAMLVYCQSRLSGINSQCREIMTRQDKNAKAQAATGNLLTTLYRYQDQEGATDAQKAEIRNAYGKAIDAVGANTSLGEALAKDRATLSTGNKNEIDSLINATKNHQSELNSDAEIDMIRLQSLMSQRQTAIQLTTNIIQSLNDQANKIVANIGH